MMFANASWDKWGEGIIRPGGMLVVGICEMTNVSLREGGIIRLKDDRELELGALKGGGPTLSSTPLAGGVGKIDEVGTALGRLVHKEEDMTIDEGCELE